MGTLLDTLKRKENYVHFAVRVAYIALSVPLGKPMQKRVIGQKEHEQTG
jgi:hypothetical protein